MTDYDRVIPPGKEGKIHATVDVSKVNGPFSKSVLVMSSDPQRPQIRLTLKGTVRQALQILPSANIFFRGRVGETKTEEVSLVARPDIPLEIQNIISSTENIKAELITDTPGEKYRLKVTMLPTKAPGRFNERLTLRTNLENMRRVNINVRGRIESNFTVVPTSLYFGTVDLTNANGRPIRRMLTINKEDGEPFAIKGIIPSNTDLFSVQQESFSEDRRYRISVTLDPEKVTEADKGPLHEQLNIQLENEPVPVIRVAIRGRIE